MICFLTFKLQSQEITMKKHQKVSIYVICSKGYIFEATTKAILRKSAIETTKKDHCLQKSGEQALWNSY